MPYTEAYKEHYSKRIRIAAIENGHIDGDAEDSIKQQLVMHVFILFYVVNIYDLIVLDWGIFCHSKKLRILGTEDMEKEYKDYMFHVRSACIGIVLGLIVALLSGCIIHFCFVE